jgi:hypothetical protein
VADYIDVAGIHQFESEPVRLVCELDREGMETRKVELAREDVASSADIGLGYVPVPPLEEMNSDPQFRGISISAADFDSLWNEYVSAKGR